MLSIIAHYEALPNALKRIGIVDKSTPDPVRRAQLFKYYKNRAQQVSKYYTHRA